MRAFAIFGLFILFGSSTIENRSYRLRPIKFEINSDKLTDTQSRELDTVITTIRRALKETNKKSFTLWISGNCDMSEKKVKRLSLNRAIAVRDKLLRLGFTEGTLVARGYGKERPIAESTTEDGRRQNARVDFRIALE